ncbi:hypothetical protein [Parasphingorhabdus halotolerans]|uniref:Uncharacterized protein n=1 Tax=Parasphingorhabdus halotolerans TaxID=2725558 RepID=A0A6H2DNP1_9SPHN|nr:hypothetical protein [Parasphingorhabdus halotolerans]QJB69276.1 hypothetical protein HF685_08280 [Parasphingorhabdus halotolerans]
MNQSDKIQEISETLCKILSQLDELQQPIAAIKVAEAISALSESDSEGKWAQDA